MDNSKSSILLSIKPIYAALILSGRKTIELRKAFSKDALHSRIYLYSTSPAKKIIGAVDIKSVESVSIDEINANYIDKACIDEKTLFEYYKNNKTGIIIEVENPLEFREPVALAQLRKMKHPPHNSHRKILVNDKLEQLLSQIYAENLQNHNSKAIG
ncbi:MAG: ASCH domain-containing protein [Planctomycetes bacterium]|nr:ASCH domain-containing protein [Planctomycetota bacterium]